MNVLFDYRIIDNRFTAIPMAVVSPDNWVYSLDGAAVVGRRYGEERRIRIDDIHPEIRKALLTTRDTPELCLGKGA